jgi:hypothetical protein
MTSKTGANLELSFRLTSASLKALHQPKEFESCLSKTSVILFPRWACGTPVATRTSSSIDPA